MVNLTSVKLRVNHSPLARRPLNRSETGVNSTSSCPMLLGIGIVGGGECRASSISVHECVTIRISTVYSLHTLLFFVNVLF